MALDETRRLMEQNFREHKKDIKLEQCIEYIAKYHKDDMEWFKTYCLEEVPVKGKDGKEKLDDEQQPITSIRSFLTIKQAFYEKYFKGNGEKNRRERLFEAYEVSNQ